MNFLITESQLKTILLEEDNSSLTNSMKKLFDFTKKIVAISEKKYKLNSRFLLTWGAAIGGLLMPLDNFLKSGDFNINEFQTSLVLLGVASMMVYENKELTSKVISKIKEEGLYETFKKVLSKSIKLEKSFKEFLDSIGIVSSNMVELMGYAFLLPIFGDIQSIANRTGNLQEVAMMIAERIIASKVVVMSGEAIISVIKKIINRLK